MRSKAQYDEFVDQFGKIPFPLHQLEVGDQQLMMILKEHIGKYIFREES